MKITILTLFPEIFPLFLNFSILGRAQKKGLIKFELVDLRRFGEGVHRIVDDKPYGGGTGMILKPTVLAAAVQSIIQDQSNKPYIILTSASGPLYHQQQARQLAQKEEIVIICGHYEGVDQRFIDKYVDEEISIGQYVLTGGEIPALIISDSVTRLIPGVLKKEAAVLNESFENGLLEHPHYTRPPVFEDISVPDVLVSGNHQQIEKWRQDQSSQKTAQNLPKLIKS